MPLRLNPQSAQREIDLQGHTVTAVAAVVGMDRSNLSHCLAGRRVFPAEKIRPLAEFLGVDPYLLLGPDDPREAVIELARLYDLSPDELVAAS